MDIRSFFGTTKKKTDPPAGSGAPTVSGSTMQQQPRDVKSPLKISKAASHPTKPEKKRVVVDDDFDALVDSEADDDQDESFDEDYDSDEDTKKKGKRSKKITKKVQSASGKKAEPLAKAKTEPVALSTLSGVSSSKYFANEKVSDIHSPVLAGETVSAQKRTTTDAISLSSSAKKQKTDSVNESVVGGIDIQLPLQDPEKKAPKKRALPTTVSDPNSVVKKAAIDSSGEKGQGGPGLYFDDMRIGVTGIFDRMSRDAVEEYIKENGGKIASSISGKTSLLVIGHQLDDGREVTSGNKYKTAIEKKVPIMNEEEFFTKYDPAKKPTASFAQPLPVPKAIVATSAPMATTSINTNGSSALKQKLENAHDISLWVDRYKPQTPDDLIGHGDIVRKLQEWLRNWNAVHIKKSIKVPFTKENPGAKAVLLSGPPGIGKSSVAGIMAKSMGYDVLELNASDTRNKREIEEKLIEAVSTKAISSHGLGFTSSSSSSNVARDNTLQNRLVIMDEVDGMGGSDRGGIAELIKIIKQSKIPIICICNDRQSPKVKSLANHCYDLRVKRPMKAQIANRLIQIAATEGLQVEQNAAQMLVEQSGNDIRQALNALQMWSYGSKVSATTNQAKYMSYQDMKQGIGRIEKDKVLRQTPFDACSMLLGGEKRSPWDDRYNSFFIDYSLVPLLIQQNYIDSAKSGILRNLQLSEIDKLEALSKASDAVSDIDMVGSKIRGQDQHWELLPTQAVFCVSVGNQVNGFQEFPSFPAWLGKYSSTTKKNRLTRELVHHSSLSIGQGFLPMRMDYVPYLRSRLLRPLLSKGKEGVPETVGMLETYGLTKDDFMESMKEMQFIVENNKIFSDKYEQIDTQTKTALTKYYNNAGIKSGTVVPEIGGVRKGKKNKATDDIDEELLGDEDNAVMEEQEDDNEEEDIATLRSQLLANKPKSAKGTTKTPKASTSQKSETTKQPASSKGKKK